MGKIVTIEKIEDVLIVNSPYNNFFVKEARLMHGKWNAKERWWEFPSHEEKRLRQVCLEIYGDDGNDMQTIDFVIDVDTALDGKSIYFLDNKLMCENMQLAIRHSRDWAVKLSENVSIEKGEFDEWGGSRANPRVTYDGNLYLIVRDYPISLYNKLDKKGITSLTTNKKEELLKEKENLMLRLAEINKELENL